MPGRLRWIVLLVAIIFRPALAGSPEPTVVGFWQQVDADGGVGGWFYFSERDGLYDGRLVKMFPKPGGHKFERCEKCRGARHNAPMLGLTIVSNMRRVGRHYEGGSILDPRDGTVYEAEMDLSADASRLAVRGYLGLPLFGQTQVWSRLPDDAMPKDQIPGAAQSPAGSRL